MTDVRIGIFSMSARSPDGLDGQYLEWHGLDHLPEQYRIDGLRNGTRWVSTPACRTARAASDQRYDEVDHVVAYLFAAPVEVGLDRFFSLGAELRAAGRMPLRLPLIELGGFVRRGGAAAPRALVDADVLPWRPARGVYLLIERATPAPPDALLTVPGVAGVWSFEGTDSLHERLTSTEGLQLTVAYLDGDPPEVAARLSPVLAERWASGNRTPLLAAPFIAVVPWQWEAALPE